MGPVARVLMHHVIKWPKVGRRIFDPRCFTLQDTAKIVYNGPQAPLSLLLLLSLPPPSPPPLPASLYFSMTSGNTSGPGKLSWKKQAPADSKP